MIPDRTRDITTFIMQQDRELIGILIARIGELEAEIELLRNAGRVVVRSVMAPVDRRDPGAWTNYGVWPRR